MADSVSFKMLTEPFTKGIHQREARMPRAAMYAVREAGRVAKTAGRKQAPVLKDTSKLSHAKLQRYSRAGFNVKAAYAGNQPIPGLLKASIHSSKRLKQLGDSEFSLKVGPRGERVHLYAGKIEERAHYMAAAEAAAKAAMPAIAQKAFNRVWKGSA
jgi:hypothetical protein